MVLWINKIAVIGHQKLLVCVTKVPCIVSEWQFVRRYIPMECRSLTLWRQWNSFSDIRSLCPHVRKICATIIDASQLWNNMVPTTRCHYAHITYFHASLKSNVPPVHYFKSRRLIMRSPDLAPYDLFFWDHLKKISLNYWWKCYGAS